MLFHGGWSGQNVFMDVARGRFFIILTTRCGDYERAKRERFELFNDFYLYDNGR